MGRSFKDQVVLVTGASAGIGEALARELARRGAKVGLAARRVERLEAAVAEIAAAGGEAMAVGCDVTRDGSVEEAAAKVKERFGRIDVVVANAGFGVAGRLDRLTLDDYRRQLETNVFGVLRTIYATLDELKRTSGCLVLIGSVAAYLSAPAQSAYAMSKHAVRALAEAVALELAPGVAVVLVNPGFVESEIRRVSRRGVYHPEAKDPIPRWLQMPRDKAARKIADAIAARRRERILSAHGQLGVLLARHAPWVLRLAARSGAARRIDRAK